MGCRRVRKAGKVLPLRFYFSVLRQWGKMPAPNPIFAKGSDIADLWKASLHPIGAMGRILKYAISFFQKAVLVRGEAEPKKEGGMILSRPL